MSLSGSQLDQSHRAILNVVIGKQIDHAVFNQNANQSTLGGNT